MWERERGVGPAGGELGGEGEGRGVRVEGSLPKGGSASASVEIFDQLESE